MRTTPGTSQRPPAGVKCTGGTRNELQRGPLHVQFAALANLTMPDRALDNPIPCPAP